MNSYVIMNAGCLFDNKSATLTQCAEAWPGTQTILVCQRERGYEQFSKIFISGSGHGYENAPNAGDHIDARYTQDTGMGYSNKDKRLRIHNVIEMVDGEVTNPGNGIGLTEKRRAWCMK